MHDLVIRNGTIVDGTGADATPGDIAVDDGIITEIGSVDGGAHRTIDADGAIVTPGFVDIHTHYDGQVTWDSAVTPTCWHGVTTVVMGNCGVGFAPVHPEERDWIIGLMEGVEDIPGAALSAGIDWQWETFPQYLDALEQRPLILDVGTQVPHGAVRAYVMGDRGARNQPATAEDIEQMAAIVREGINAGALGFSTSRTVMHTAVDGEPVPGTFAAEDELFGIGRVLGELGTGVFELAPAGAMGEDLLAPDRELDWIVRLAAEIGRPVSYALTQNEQAPDDWRRMLALSAAAVADGHMVLPQVHARSVCLLIGLQTFHPLSFTPGWAELADLPVAEQAAKLRDPDRRARLIQELEALADDPIVGAFMHPSRMYPLGDPPNYEPDPQDALAARAAGRGQSMWAALYDALAADGGQDLLLTPVLNFAGQSLDPSYEMLSSPATVFGLGDGGAHAGQTCDASSTTFLLTHWVRDRAGARLRLEDAVKKMTGDTAAVFGLGDRGLLAPGLRADLNVIDMERLQLRRPQLVHDLPGGASRLIQRAEGYMATICAGETTLVEGEDTGARPGALIRGER